MRNVTRHKIFHNLKLRGVMSHNASVLSLWGLYRIYTRVMGIPKVCEIVGFHCDSHSIIPEQVPHKISFKNIDFKGLQF